MIQYLIGKIGLKDEKMVVIEVGGVGYKVFCSPNTIGKITERENIKIINYPELREDAAEP